MNVATLNLWGTAGAWTRRLDVAARGLAAMDAILVQEVAVAPASGNTAELLAARLGDGWHVAYGQATVEQDREEGLAILARQPLADVATVELPDARPGDRRILLSARAGDVALHTTHLHYRLADGLARERQVVAIDAAIRARGGELHILGGDFNAPPDADEIRFLAGRHTLDGRRTFWQDAFAAAHPGERGATWSRANPNTAALAWLELERRIDYLFISPEKRDGRGRVVSARVILDAPDGGVFASDHFGVAAELVARADGA